jgi:hypothetical protein
VQELSGESKITSRQCITVEAIRRRSRFQGEITFAPIRFKFILTVYVKKNLSISNTDHLHFINLLLILLYEVKKHYVELRLQKMYVGKVAKGRVCVAAESTSPLYAIPFACMPLFLSATDV